MKRKARKDPDQQAKGRLGVSGDHVEARRALAEAQTARIEQLRRRDEGELLESAQVHDVLVRLGAALRVQLLGVENRLRAGCADRSACSTQARPTA